MNGWLIAVTALFSLSTASASSTTEVVPAWQEPGFVMEEVVVTAVIGQAALPAWQESGFVMEEVIATATAADVANALREQRHRRARIHVADLTRADLSE